MNLHLNKPHSVYILHSSKGENAINTKHDIPIPRIFMLRDTHDGLWFNY